MYLKYFLEQCENICSKHYIKNFLKRSGDGKQRTNSGDFPVVWEKTRSGQAWAPGDRQAELFMVKGRPHSLRTSAAATFGVCGSWEAAALVVWLVLSLQLCGVVARNTGLRSPTACVQVLALSLPSWVTRSK